MLTHMSQYKNYYAYRQMFSNPVAKISDLRRNVYGN